MKKTFLICLLFLLISCNKYESNLNSMMQSVKKEILDNAFKDGAKVDIMELYPIEYDTVSNTLVDSFNLYKLNNMSNAYYKKLELQSSAVKNLIDALNIYKLIGATDMITMYIPDLDESMKKLKDTQEQIKVIEKEDSLIRISIKNDKSGLKIYRLKIFIKAKFTDLKDSTNNENILDTVHYFFNKELSIIKLKDFDKQFNF